jgi:hypothetical protein
MLCAGMLLFNAGRVRCSTSAGAAQNIGGTPTTSTGVLALSLTAPTARLNSAGYNAANGALCADIGGAINVRGQGLAFSAADRVVCDQVSAISTYFAGLPFTAAGALATAAPE